jgi:amino acid adenylation domain-containing protein
MVHTGQRLAGLAEAPARYPALPAQQGMILDSLRNPEDGVDIIQVVLDWAEPLRRAPFEAAWHGATRRHEILRTAFPEFDEHGLVQVVVPDARMDIRWLDLPSAPPDGPDAPLAAFLLSDRRAGFDPARAPLARLAVLRRVPPDPGQAPTEAYQAVLTHHHALLDGRSLRMLVEEVCACYAAGTDDVPAGTPQRPPFHEFVRYWYAADTSAARRFWTGYLAGLPASRPLPGYLGPQPPGRAQPGPQETVLDHTLSDQLRKVAAAAGVGPSVMVSAAWAWLRARYSGVDDVAVAVTRTCRYASIPDAGSVVGPLINTVPLRLRFDPQWTVLDLLTAVNEGLHRIRDHLCVPLASILAWSGLPAGAAALDSLVLFERRQPLSGMAGPGAPAAARIERLPSYPVTVYAFDEPEIRILLLCDRRRFVEGSARCMLDQLAAALAGFAAAPDTRLGALRLPGAAPADPEPGTARRTTARRTGEYPRHLTVPALFAAQVARRPGATALICGPDRWTYADLDRRGNALAWQLRRRGVGTDTPVAVALPRGADLVVALLAVLKAGGAYLAVDPAAPPARVAGLLDRAGARLALATGATAAALRDASDVDVVRMDGWRGEPPDEERPPPDVAHPLSLAYVSFTSGTTGGPKGVAIPHRGVVRLVSDPTFATLGPSERLLHLSPVAFDASTLEIWGALLTGAAVVTAPAHPLAPADLASLLRDQGVTLAWLTAGLFHQLVEQDPAALAGVRCLLTGGDVVDPDAARAALAVRGGRPLVNGYGPTENTTFTACHVMRWPEQVGLSTPVGRPIQHTTVRILDGEGHPVPVGVPGELYAGGDGLARGYTGDAAATARAFVPDPGGDGARLYRTGDLARWRADGTLEFLGRLDDQVKVRGYRVEPGVVAAVLRGHPAVRDAVVLVRGDGEQRHLVGYVTPTAGADPRQLRPARLREFLSGRLPSYLVPVALTVLDTFPLTSNGKVDRGALPEPRRQAGPDAAAPGAPPLRGTEHRLAEVWRTLLPAHAAADLGRDDNFFDLGGNSLTAARLVFRVREVFGVDLPIGAFYEKATLAACAGAIETAAARQPGGSAPIARRDRRAYRTPTPERPATGDSPGERRRSRVLAEPSTPNAAPGERRRSRVLAEPSTPNAAPGERRRSRVLPLAPGWALWRTLSLRATGLPVELLDRLADPALAAAADAAGRAPEAEAGYHAAFPDAVRRLSAALHDLGRLPALREAVAWQNRHALQTGIDALVRRGPHPDRRDSRHRQHEALLASYLQRYTTKNDTIGFFGPVAWSRIGDGPGIRVTPAPAGAPPRARVTYLEGWAVQAALAGFRDALRPWLAPRRMPYLDVRGDRLHVPLAPPVPLAPLDAAVLRACDGSRDAIGVAARVRADPRFAAPGQAEVFAVLRRLHDARRLAWQPEVAPHDIRPERSVRALLSRVTDRDARERAGAALDELVGARDRLAAAAGDDTRVADAMADLEAVVARRSGASPTRRPGAAYAGRTPAYEECLRAGTVRIGADALDGLRGALALVLDSASWFTAACAGCYARHFAEVYRQRAAALGTGTVPFADFWLMANDALFDRPPALLAPALRALRRRWATLLPLGQVGQRVRLRSADLRERVAALFPRPPRLWPTAVHHSVDLLVAGVADGADLRWVLGELHPSLVTNRYASWVAFHDDPDALRAGMREDLGGGAVFAAETGVAGGTSARLSNALAAAGDRRLVFAHDSGPHDAAPGLAVGECDVVRGPDGPRVRHRDGGFEEDLLAVLGDLLAAGFAQSFTPLPPAAHTPRVTVDNLVVSRESWTLPATQPPFAGTVDERIRYRQARDWAARLGLPRHVFLRATGERKPIYADLTSLASVDLLSRAVRRCRRVGGAGGTLTITEMLPTPEQAWLADAGGHRYTAELRMVAVDQHAGGAQAEPVFGGAEHPQHLSGGQS